MKTHGNNQFNAANQIASYVDDTGTANAYVIALRPAITVYTVGLLVSFKVANSNTGASTLAVNGLAPIPLKKQVSFDLAPNDIVIGQVVDAVYDGINFQIIAAPPIIPTGTTELIYGGDVIWSGVGYLYDVGITVPGTGYYINGVFYQAPYAQHTLVAADPLLDRIDTFIVDTSSVSSVLTGIPAVNPLPAPIDIGTQFILSYILVEAGTTSPSQDECIYLENTEWTTTASGTINPNSTVTPYSGTKDVRATNADDGDNILFNRGSTLRPAVYTKLSFRLRPSNSPWGNKKFTIQWELATVPIGSAVIMASGAYGFNDSFTAYQLIEIPVLNFGLSLTDLADSIRITIGTQVQNLSFFLDEMCIRITPAVPPVIANLTFDNGLTRTVNNVQLGGFLIHDTINNTNYFRHFLSGYTIYDYPYQFSQQQGFQVGTSIASFTHLGENFVQIGAQTGNHGVNTVRIGINYTDAIYQDATPGPLINSYFQNDYQGFWLGTNVKGHGSFGLDQDDNTAKNNAIFFHIKDSGTEGITLFSRPAAGGTYINDMGSYRSLSILTDKDVQLWNYPNTRDDGVTTKALYVDSVGKVKYGGISGVGGGTSGYSGYSGYSGVSGFSGDNPGSSGYSGYSGANPGASGYSGYSGNNPGSSGFSGFSGFSGDNPGSSGYSGYSGAAGSGGSITADNGITANTSTNVRLGGTGIQDTNIDWANFTWTNTWNTIAGDSGLKLTSTSTAATGNSQKVLEVLLSGVNANADETTYAGYFSNTHTAGINNRTSIGLYANGQDFGVYGNTPGGAYGVFGQVQSGFGVGVYGYASEIGGTGSGVIGATEGSGTGVFAHTGTGYAIFGETFGGIAIGTTSVGNYAAEFNRQESTGGNIGSVFSAVTIDLSRIAGTVIDGVGEALEFKIVTTDNAIHLSNQIISKWTTANNATRVSEFSITGVDNAVTSELLVLSGSGALKLDKYGSGNFTGTPTYTLQVDASGNVIEGTGGGGITADNGLIATTSTNVQLGDSSGPGAPLIHDTYIDADVYGFNITGSIQAAGNGGTECLMTLTNTNSLGTALRVTGTFSNDPTVDVIGTSTAIRGNAITGVAGIGSFGVSGTGAVIGVLGLTTTANSLGVVAQSTLSSTNTAANVMSIRRNTTGTPTNTSFNPYSPSSLIQQGNTLFWFLVIASAIRAAAEPGA